MDKLQQSPVTYVDGDLQTVASWSATLSSMESNFSFYPYDIYIHVVMFRYLVCLITLQSMQPWFKGTPVHFMKRFSLPEVSLLRRNHVKHLHTETKCYNNTDIHHFLTTYLIGNPSQCNCIFVYGKSLCTFNLLSFNFLNKILQQFWSTSSSGGQKLLYQHHSVGSDFCSFKIVAIGNLAPIHLLILENVNVSRMQMFLTSAIHSIRCTQWHCSRIKLYLIHLFIHSFT